jgi:peptidoglycan/xylan/chitin deacetylase (PgdA/CDA1 family)
MSPINNLTIVMYHYVRPIKNSRFPRIKGLELEGFRRQLDYLSNKHTFITAERLIGCTLGAEDLPKNSCFLTFDDGYKDHIQHVMPELLTRGIQGSFFPPVNAVEKRDMLDVNAIHFILASLEDIDEVCIDMNSLMYDYGYSASEVLDFQRIWAISGRYDLPKVMYFKHMLQHVLPSGMRGEIISKLFKKYVGVSQSDFSEELYLSLSDAKKLIECGMYVGSHGAQHIWLDKESNIAQRSEIDSSLQFLQKVGAPINNWIMCYPYGAYNEDTLSILREKDCAVGLTTKVGLAEVDPSKMLELKRFDTNDFPR